MAVPEPKEVEVLIWCGAWKSRVLTGPPILRGILPYTAHSVDILKGTVTILQTSAASAAALAILSFGCANNVTNESSAAAPKNAVDIFDLTDRNGKAYVVTDLHSCAAVDKMPGEKRCDYSLLYFLAGGVHYRFDWATVRSLERDTVASGDVFRLTLETSQTVTGTFDQAPIEGRQPPPIGAADSLSGALVEMGGNTAIFPAAVINSLRRRAK